MNRIIFACVMLIVVAGGEPVGRNYQVNFAAQQQQQQNEAPYPAAEAPTGQLLLVPGEYVVQVNNAPYQEYGVPAVEPIQQYISPVFTGQLRVQSGVQQQPSFQQFTQSSNQQRPRSRQQFGRLVQQSEENKYPETEQKNTPPKVASRGDKKFASPKPTEQDQFVQEQFRQQQESTSNRLTSPKDQVEVFADENQFSDDSDDSTVENINSAQYKEPQKSDRYTQPQNRQYFGRYYQQNQRQQYTPPRKYIPSRTTTEQSTTTEENYDSTTTEVATTTERQIKGGILKDNYRDNGDAENIDNQEKTESQGFYYLLLPDGKLQRVVYMTEENLKKMAFVARLQYQNVAPIQGPVYAYDPEKSPFVQVF